MAVFERSTIRQRRFLVFVRAQLPLLVGATFVIGTGLIVVPELRDDAYLLLGGLIILVSCVIGLLVPWRNITAPGLIALAIADVVGVAFVHVAMHPYVPSVDVLVVYPVLWLAYGFTQGVVIAAVAGTLFIALFPYLVTWTVPRSSLAWLDLVTLPVLVIGIAILANLAAGELRMRRQKMVEAFEVQRAALEEAQASAAIARSIFDTVQAGLALIAVDGQYTGNERAFNTAAAIGFDPRHPPYSGDRMYETDRTTLVPAAEQPIVRGMAGEVVEQHFSWVGDSHQKAAIITSTSPVRRDTGELLGTVIVMYDVTELAEAIEIREEFLRTVSHELRTPLTAAVGYLELLEDDEDLPPRLAYRLETVRRAMGRLTERIAELMAASDDGIDLKRSRLDICRLIDACIDNADATIRGRVVRFGTEVTGLVVDVDARHMSQAIGELLTNAKKFSADDMPIIVRVVEHPEHIEIQITDSGRGMTRSELARVFDSFYRAPSARTEAIQGFGLGLHIVRNILKAHGGDIELRSEVGVGTTAVVTLPRAVESRMEF